MKEYFKMEAMVYVNGERKEAMEGRERISSKKAGRAWVTRQPSEQQISGEATICRMWWEGAGRVVIGKH